MMHRSRHDRADLHPNESAAQPCEMVANHDEKAPP
jgi:hypothetical protein